MAFSLLFNCIHLVSHKARLPTQNLPFGIVVHLDAVELGDLVRVVLINSRPTCKIIFPPDSCPWPWDPFIDDVLEIV